MNNNASPIALFTYKRADTLKQTINSLLQCDQSQYSDLYVFSDGPKTPEEADAVKEVRDYVQKIEGFKSITLKFSEKNSGLAASVIAGVTTVFEKYNSIIVLEDDLIVTPNFLQFMNTSLSKYETEKKVFSVSAYSFNLTRPINYTADAYFLNRGWSWGWATWKDRWVDIDWQIKNYNEFSKNSKLKHEFNKGGSDLTQMLRKQMKRKIDSWAIRWFYHQFQTRGVTLYPVYSKVLNIGFGEFATHTTGSNKRYIPNIADTDKNDFVFPAEIKLDPDYLAAFQTKMGILSRAKSKLTTLYIKYFGKFK